MKATVYDLVIVPREVELPARCPKCGVEIVDERPLTHNDPARVREITRSSGDYVGDPIVVSIQCGECGEALAHNREEEHADWPLAGEGVTVDVCPVCKEPCHASEGNDEGKHPECIGDKS